MGRQIREIMSKPPLTVPTTASLAEAASIMRDRDVGDVLVVDADGCLCGIVTDRDIIVRAIADARDPQGTQVGTVCTENVECVEPDDDVDEAIELMAEKSIRRVPVCEGGKPVGFLSLGDLAVKRDPDSVLGQVSAAPPNQ